MEDECMETVVIISIIVAFYLVIFLVWRSISKSLDIAYQKNKIESDKLIKDTVIDDSAIKSLDSLINEIIEEYVILELRPKDVFYINNSIESEMREYIVNQITERIPVLLMKKLEYVCNPNYIGDLIGKRVYMSVMNYVLEFNVNSEHKPKNNVGRE